MGYSILFECFLNSHKSETFKKIEKYEASKKKTVLYISWKNSAKIEMLNSKEIKYGGKMYDIIKMENKNDGIYYYCYDDEKEDKIINWFSNFFNLKANKDNQSKSPAAEYALNNLLKYFINSQKFHNDIPISYTAYTVKEIDLYLQPSIKIVTPPPQGKLRFA